MTLRNKERLLVAIILGLLLTLVLFATALCLAAARAHFLVLPDIGTPKERVKASYWATFIPEINAELKPVPAGREQIPAGVTGNRLVGPDLGPRPSTFGSLPPSPRLWRAGSRPDVWGGPARLGVGAPGISPAPLLGKSQIPNVQIPKGTAPLITSPFCVFRVFRGHLC